MRLLKNCITTQTTHPINITNYEKYCSIEFLSVLPSSPSPGPLFFEDVVVNVNQQSENSHKVDLLQQDII